MSTPPKSLRLTREELPDSPDWVDRLLLSQVPFQDQTSQALNRALTFGQNIQSQLATVDVVGPSPAWTSVATLNTITQDPIFQNGWVNYADSSYFGAGFTIDPVGVVRMRGVIASGTINTTAFTLPAGYRPERKCGFGSYSNGAFGAAQVLSTGAVNPTVGNNTYFFIDGITFQAAIPCAAPPRPTGPGWPIPIKLTIPTVSWVHVASCVDLSAPFGAATTFGTGAVPEWGLGDGVAQIRHVPGLSPGRRYRLTLLLLAG